MLIVGPVTWDRFGGERRPGGAVAYAARVASALGIRAAVATTAASDADLSNLEGHDVRVVPSRTTLTFDHETTAEGRRLHVPVRLEHPITSSDVPADWLRADELILAPLLPDDIDLRSFDGHGSFRNRWILAQGVQRQTSEDGGIHIAEAPTPELLHLVSLGYSVFLSSDETSGWTAADFDVVAARAVRLVVTRGSEGARIYRGTSNIEIEPCAAEAVDTTGAGDVFATAFILAVSKFGLDDAEAGQLASAFAAASVERVGPASLPPLREVGQRIGVTAGDRCA